MKKLTLIAAAAAVFSAPLSAQGAPNMTTAKNPAELSITLMNAGYDVELSEDSYGDPLISSSIAGYPLRIYFFGCDEDTNDGCDSLQLSTGFDRKEPWTPAEAIKISEELRYASVRLDDEGDPYVSWDIITGDGIPTPVFMRALRQFEDTVRNAADIAFADED